MNKLNQNIEVLTSNKGYSIIMVELNSKYLEVDLTRVCFALANFKNIDFSGRIIKKDSHSIKSVHTALELLNVSNKEDCKAILNSLDSSNLLLEIITQNNVNKIVQKISNDLDILDKNSNQ